MCVHVYVGICVYVFVHVCVFECWCLCVTFINIAAEKCIFG